MSETVKCPVCGETAPEPRWICLTRSQHTPGQKCDNSVEGDQRVRDFLNYVESLPEEVPLSTPPLPQ